MSSSSRLVIYHKFYRSISEATTSQSHKNLSSKSTSFPEVKTFRPSLWPFRGEKTPHKPQTGEPTFWSVFVSVRRPADFPPIWLIYNLIDRLQRNVPFLLAATFCCRTRSTPQVGNLLWPAFCLASAKANHLVTLRLLFSWTWLFRTN